MTRAEFTYKIAQLIVWTKEDAGLDLIADWLLRDLETQKRMFGQGKSKCDGIVKVSAHQSGKALDIYIIDKGVLSWDKAIFNILHDKWDEMGGAPRIDWDLGHFEGA